MLLVRSPEGTTKRYEEYLIFVNYKKECNNFFDKTRPEKFKKFKTKFMYE